MPYVGEIRLFAGNFAPVGWALCQGQLIPISENDVLFNLIGTTFGGDGQETFALPDLQGRVPVHQGQGPGIQGSYLHGQSHGVESVTLTPQQMPVHDHALLATTGGGSASSPRDALLASTPAGDRYVRDQPTQPLKLAQTVAPVGGSQPHDNMPPFVTINYIISLFGEFPSQ